MSKTTMKIGAGFSLDVDAFLTSTQVILAQKGKGKSYLASVQAEELLEAGQQVVVIDPTSAWFGLRASADGKRDGYPIAILGGDHGDVPLEATAGELVANAIATEHFSAVIDISLFRKAEGLRFMAAFMETLYRVNREALHLFIDEADVVAPQKTFSPEQARALGAAEDIVRRGRIKGIGCTLISQRAQVINKDVLTQADMLTTLGMNHPKDIGAIDAWVATHGDPKKAAQMIESLPALPKGEAWVWAPAQDLFRRVAIRAKRTFDSGRTPRAGERAVAPKRLAQVDIAKLGAAIAETAERAKADHPKTLKARIAELEKELAAKVPRAKVEQAPIKESHLQRIGVLLEAGDRHVTWLNDAAEKASSLFETASNKALGHGDKLASALAELRLALAGPGSGRTSAAPRIRPDLVGAFEHAGAKRPTPAPSDGSGALTPADREFLNAIAWWNTVGVYSPTLHQVAFVSGSSAKSSTFLNRRSSLRTRGLVSYPTNGSLELTDAGTQNAEIAPVHSLAYLHERIRRQLDPADVRMLDALIGLWPMPATTEALANLTGASATSSTFLNRRSKLSGLGLVTYPSSGTVIASELVMPRELVTAGGR